MKNHRDLLGFLINILIVVMILLAIVFGLNRIGVYDLPDSVERFFNRFESVDNSNAGNDALIYDSLGFDENDSVAPRIAELNYENAKDVLENVKADVNYSQELVVETFAGESSRVERFIISKKNDSFDVSVYNEFDKLLKTISTKDGLVFISNNDSFDEPSTVRLPMSDFSISDECGFVHTHSDFLESDFNLDRSGFGIEKGKYGSNLLITFEDSFENYKKTQNYTICLDYGIVTDAECYENGVLVYKMSTVSLHQVN